ncbi:hypothetical protein C9374_010819 [Naegleria lovaniensis]|uniref:Uncharacterized protein n=1 Tax=Naegleria lovaniensis TaxID=51637 RepID=A0AA88GB77_NAELO|nr:uncharacterized protein C9374_010819 [Naegleria lovaniensis]KAG2374535.1 hypothetical protein C9374_010819 [Naegleria lovaniensis]
MQVRSFQLLALLILLLFTLCIFNNVLGSHDVFDELSDHVSGHYNTIHSKHRQHDHHGHGRPPKLGRPGKGSAIGIAPQPVDENNRKDDRSVLVGNNDRGNEMDQGNELIQV